MTKEQIAEEFKKGCSNTIGRHPRECDQCYGAAIDALVKLGITDRTEIKALLTS